MPVGDIFWADLPASDGHEQAGRRPVLIVQDDGYAGSLPTTIIVPITSSRAALRLPGTVAIGATATNGLAYDSVLLVFQIRVLDRRRLRRQIGVADPLVISEVYDALDALTGRQRLPATPPGTP
jgi:mRNA interferase MazF